ncbi:MAG: thioesterase family protein [Thermodesulfobacteriota bacterium]|nr:thioesterase family protein [Thermodesulfobacteriota bacterium]
MKEQKLLNNKVEYRVIYADTDKMGVVYYTNYIKLFEIGRTELFRSAGYSYLDIEKRGYSIPVSKAYCHYLKSARYDDIIVIETMINYIKKASIRFDYVIKNKSTEELLVTGYTVHAFMNDGKITRVPDFISEIF